MSGSRLSGVPPGRAGRAWLRRRLATAQRGREQLDRKLQILVVERRRLLLLQERQQQDWSQGCDDLRAWLLRAALLGGQDAVRIAATRAPATVAVLWAGAMGVTYPVEVQVAPGDPEPDRSWGNAAVAPARAAAWRAVESGARLAVTEEALRRMDVEIGLTRRRVRALDRRWLPRLGDALHDLELVLEQGEQEDGIRLRHGGAASRGGRAWR